MLEPLKQDLDDMGLEDLTADQIMLILEKLEIFAYIFLAIFAMQFLGRIIPSYLQYRSIKYLEIKIITKEHKNVKQQPTQMGLYLPEKLKKWRKKEKDDLYPIKK